MTKNLIQKESTVNFICVMYIMVVLFFKIAYGYLVIKGVSLSEWMRFIPLTCLIVYYVVFLLKKDEFNYRIFKTSFIAINILHLVEGMIYGGKMLFNHFNFESIVSYPYFYSYFICLLIGIILLGLYTYFDYKDKLEKGKKNFLLCKIINIVICALLLFAVIDANVNPLSYKKEGEEITIMGIKPLYLKTKEVNIPDKIGKRKVTKIDNEAFQYSISLEKVTIGENVVEIGDNAFRLCTYLKEVEFKNENNLKKIGVGSFKTDYSLSIINLPKSIEIIENEAFCATNFDLDFSMLTSLKEIGEYAFENCDEIKDIVFPNSIESIGQSAFEYCDIHRIEFPDDIKLETICVRTFAFNFNLSEIEFNDANIKKIENWAFLYCKGLNEIRFNENIELIGYSCLGETYIKDIYMPNKYVECEGHICSNYKIETASFIEPYHDVTIHVPMLYFTEYNEAIGYNKYKDNLKSYE